MKGTYCSAAAVLLAAALCATCGGSSSSTGGTPSDASGPPGPLPWDLHLQPVAVPVTTSTFQPQLTSSPKGVILSWVELGEAGAALKFIERGTGDWSEPRTVATSEDWFMTPADVPSVLRLSSGTLVATLYPTTDGDAEAYDTQLTYSMDDGRTWSGPTTPHHDGTKTQHGFTTLFEMPDKGLGLVWLDGRAANAPIGDPDKGTMGLYFTSFDPQWRQTPEALVDARVCECCQTSAAVTPDGVLTAFRDRTQGEVRDIAISRRNSGTWTQAQIVRADGWTIQACPVNGPAISARDRDVAIAWFTAANDQPHAYAAFSQDAGRTWGQPIRLDDVSTEGKVDIELLPDGSAAASWVEFAKDTSTLQVRRVRPSGNRSAAVAVSAGRVRGYPRMVQWSDQLVFAWSEPGGIGERVQVAVGHLPPSTAR